MSQREARQPAGQGLLHRREQEERHHARLQGFSDAVFALAATLLVVTLEVPDSYDALLEAVAGFPAFAVAFAAILSLWNNHRQFFARYPLGDSWTVAINSVLLFVVLLYVYPLKLFAEAVAEFFLGARPHVLPTMGLDEVRGLFLVFGAGVLATMLVFVALHARVWHLRDTLDLDEAACVELRSDWLAYAVISALAATSVLLAALGLGLQWGLPGWPYLLAPVSSVVLTMRVRARLGAL